MRFETLKQAVAACNKINRAFTKRGHTGPVFGWRAWQYGFEVVEIKTVLPK